MNKHQKKILTDMNYICFLDITYYSSMKLLNILQMFHDHLDYPKSLKKLSNKCSASPPENTMIAIHLSQLLMNDLDRCLHNLPFYGPSLIIEYFYERKLLRLSQHGKKLISKDSRDLTIKNRKYLINVLKLFFTNKN